MKDKRDNQTHRGGARAGAGRKPAGRVQWVVRVKPEIKAAAKQKAERMGISDSDYIEALVQEDLTSPESQ